MLEHNYPLAAFEAILEDYRSNHRLRSLPAEGPLDCIDLTSNDYLGLAKTPSDEIERELKKHFPNLSYSSSASRLLSSRQTLHLNLEKRLEELYGRPALLFNSGYHANVGIISALSIPGTLFLCDKMVHASTYDGLAVGKSEFRRVPHNDINSFERAVESKYNDFERIIIVVESVYSMDGDLTPLNELVNIKRRFPKVLLYLDEAHAVGVFGRYGLGIAEAENLIDEIDILVGTFGKALASNGAFVITNDLLKKYLINNARSLIFSTALPPFNSAVSLVMLNRAACMEEDRVRLKELSDRFRKGLEAITGFHSTSQSQIIPLLTGDAKKAVELAYKIKNSGFNVLPIRRPTVPPGTERIRFSIDASLSIQDIDRLLDSIKLSYHSLSI